MLSKYLHTKIYRFKLLFYYIVHNVETTMKARTTKSQTYRVSFSFLRKTFCKANNIIKSVLHCQQYFIMILNEYTCLIMVLYIYVFYVFIYKILY